MQRERDRVRDPRQADRGIAVKKLGSDLKPGDVIAVWWAPNRDAIISLRPYEGPLKKLWPKGAQLAAFALNKSGMTIANDDWFEVIAATTSERR